VFVYCAIADEKKKRKRTWRDKTIQRYKRHVAPL